MKKYPEECSSPAIQIKYAEQGSIILHISIDRKSFTSCEILHNAIQLFIKTIFHHEEIQRTNMLDFDMVLAIADYTEQGIFGIKMFMGMKRHFLANIYSNIYIKKLES